MRTEHASPGAGVDIDLSADLNAQDDDGLGWSTIADAHEPDRVRPGSMLLVRNRYGQAVVRILAIDDTARFTSRSSPAPWRRIGTCSDGLSRELVVNAIVNAAPTSMPTATHESSSPTDRIGPVTR
jgi:hypothetical protein